jgi:hypothetical protein
MSESEEDRRKFLASCGRFAAVTPPVISLLLSTSLTSNAIARSGGVSVHEGHASEHPNHGHRHGQ